MVNKRLAGWERRRIDGSAGLEIGAWRDPTSVEFDKNATVSEVRTRLFSRYFTLVRELIESGLHSVPKLRSQQAATVNHLRRLRKT